MSSLLVYYWNQLGNRVGRGGSANSPKSTQTHTHTQKHTSPPTQLVPLTHLCKDDFVVVS